MPLPEFPVAWDRQAADARTAMEAWRLAHPAATLKDIEQEVDRQLAAMRAELIATTATAGTVSASLGSGGRV